MTKGNDPILFTLGAPSRCMWSGMWLIIGSRHTQHKDKVCVCLCVHMHACIVLPLIGKSSSGEEILRVLR